MALSRKAVSLVFAFLFILAQFPLGGQAGLEYSQPFPGGEFVACKPCRLGRGRCRRYCHEDEKADGNCRLNFFCCRPRIQKAK
ncbi:beta-defensin 105-like [Erinaceus europaeus]|uniref:Beta-defensin n=1 Tax=Erinaceus europaeus TaxID=9365 RepID=A0A1S3W407_ERIEU|nr:beta-defensin 105-like [Erinaceus europaeus]